jgi:transposase-like protein
MSGIRSALIDAGLRLEILSESSKSGAVISEVALRYGVSPGTVYGWRSEEKKRSAASCAAVDFVEFKSISQEPPQREVVARISKVSITFNNFDLCLEGKISASGLSQILVILEAAC